VFCLLARVRCQAADLTAKFAVLQENVDMAAGFLEMLARLTADDPSIGDAEDVPPVEVCVFKHIFWLFLIFLLIVPTCC
jgi:hypothetical protein